MTDYDDAVNDRPDALIVSASKLVFTKACFDGAPLEKKKILVREIKKLSFYQESTLVETHPVRRYFNLVDDTITLYFTPENLLKVVEQWPWVLDKNLGEKKQEKQEIDFRFSKGGPFNP